MPPSSLVAVVEAGGTRCTATLATPSGVVAVGTAAGCNFATLGLNAVLQRVKEATEKALLQLPVEIRAGLTLTADPPTLPLSGGEKLFRTVCIGMAGLDRPNHVAIVREPFARLFSLDVGAGDDLILGNDAMLLAIPMLEDEDTTSGIAVVAGTGSVAFATDKANDGTLQPVRRVGGYGHLLGDEGSGYHIGRLAIAHTLEAYDSGLERYSSMHLAIFKHFNLDETDRGLLLSRIYEKESSFFVDMEPVARIASVAKGVLEIAAPGQNRDPAAAKIVEEAVSALINLVVQLVSTSMPPQKGAGSVVQPLAGGSSRMLLLGGSLWNSPVFLKTFTDGLKDAGIEYRALRVSVDAGRAAAEALARKSWKT